VAGSVLVTGAGILKGVGTVGPLTVTAGGTFKPGHSPATLNAGPTTFGSGGIYNWEINSLNGTTGNDPGWDLLIVSGTLNITATNATPFILDLDTLTSPGNAIGPAAGTLNTGDRFEIVRTTGGVLGFDLSKFLLNGAGIMNVGIGRPALLLDGNSLYIYFTPEPATLSLLALSALGLLRRRRSTR
jgi:hypothetical protein